MRPLARVGCVVLGYLAAVAVAAAVVAVRIAVTEGSDRQASSGMYAFGDALLFLAVFGVAAVPATAAGLYLLRSRPAFWRWLAVAALVVAGVSALAVFMEVAPGALDASSPWSRWLGLAQLKFFVAPLFAAAFGLAAVFAPRRPARTALLAAAGIELAAFAGFALGLFAAWRR